MFGSKKNQGNGNGHGFTAKGNGDGRGKGKGMIGNVRVGKAQTRPAAPSHTPGVRQGNSVGAFDREAGIEAMEDGARATDRRSTGINPKAHVAIDPRMPNLLPP